MVIGTTTMTEAVATWDVRATAKQAAPIKPAVRRRSVVIVPPDFSR
jgi:hypothetical protein